MTCLSRYTLDALLHLALTVVPPGARHSCAADFRGLLSCWGGNMYGQTDTPRPFLDAGGQPQMLNTYCELGDYITGDPTDRRYRRCAEVGTFLPAIRALDMHCVISYVFFCWRSQTTGGP